ncbi:RNA polymerase subunit sigma-24 [Enemella evansiae]|uniref:RNA polymerase subunit sigma-24 n=1 Tax=Enemella evansiae TaxID=2016499 RepID=A0A255G6Z6_9ACTN|nr:sigma-70 family RNA polymerase sigma factor [Enemella evansiae]OYO11688.1 RNA polymerase subunit sigma-24 [Enemella evansiae]
MNDRSVRDPEDHLGERRRLTGLAYRITGVWADAEEAVAEAYARLLAADPPREPAAWLTTVTTRLAIDRLRARQREAYVGPWLPEPIDTALLPEESVVQQQTLRLGLLALCEQLKGAERAAFVLREAYAMSYAEIGLVLGVAEATARQHVSRARRRLQVPDLESSVAAETEALTRLAEALASGEVAQVAALLTDDAQVWTDGGGVVSAARNVILGPEKCARFLVGTLLASIVAPLTVNGRPGVTANSKGVRRVGWLVLRGDRIARVCIMSNPAKLARI